MGKNAQVTWGFIWVHPGWFAPWFFAVRQVHQEDFARCTSVLPGLQSPCQPANIPKIATGAQASIKFSEAFSKAYGRLCARFEQFASQAGEVQQEDFPGRAVSFPSFRRELQPGWRSQIATELAGCPAAWLVTGGPMVFCQPYAFSSNPCTVVLSAELNWLAG